MSNSVVIRRPQILKFLGVTAVAALLYRYWLLAPLLGYFGENDWRGIGFSVAIVAGLLIGFWRLSMFPTACANVIGLLAGGTWAELQSPTDVPISFTGAATAHIKLFWPHLLLVTFIVMISASSSAWLLKRRTRLDKA